MPIMTVIVRSNRSPRILTDSLTRGATQITSKHRNLKLGNTSRGIINILRRKYQSSMISQKSQLPRNHSGETTTAREEAGKEITSQPRSSTDRNDC
jgi:ribosome maturation protein Sdo1